MSGKLKCSARLSPKEMGSLVLGYPEKTQGKKEETLGDSSLITLKGALEIFKTFICIYIFPHLTEREAQ